MEYECLIAIKTQREDTDTGRVMGIPPPNPLSPVNIR